MKMKRNVASIVITCILVLYCALLITALFWALINSLKDYYNFIEDPIWFPSANYGWKFDNYWIALSMFTMKTHNDTVTVPMWLMYIYSFLYAGGCALAAAFVPCITSYIVARFKFKPLKIIYVVVIACMSIPIVGSLPAQLKLATDIGFTDNFVGMWLMAGNFLGMYFLVYYAAFIVLPKDYTEAAKIDGAGNTRIMFSIMLPLVKNAFFTVFLLQFIAFWNNYQTPLLFMPNYPMVAVGLLRFEDSTEDLLQGVPASLTACILVFIPIFILYMAFHDKLMGNLNMGGIKE